MPTAPRLKPELATPLAWVLASAAWIAASDRFILAFAHDPEQASRWALAKALGFVVVSGALLHLMLRRVFARGRAAASRLAASEARHRALVERSPDAILMHRSGDARIVFANPSAARLFGAPAPEALLGRSAFELIHPESHAGVAERIARASAGQPFPPVQVRRLFRLDGTEFRAEVALVRVDDEDGLPAVQVVLRDLSAPLRLQERLSALNRALEMLSGCNEALVRAAGESELLREICRIGVEAGGYVMAWAGMAEADPARTVRPVAAHGRDDGYLAGAALTWDDSERGRGPAGTAIRTGRACVVQDVRADPAFAPWREAAVARGYAAAALVPVTHAGQRLGVLGFYAATSGAFTPDIVHLLQQLGDDLGFGVAALRTRALLGQVLEHAPMPIYVTGPDHTYQLVNPAWSEVTGVPRDEAVRTAVTGLVPPEVAARLVATNRQVLESGVPVREEHELAFGGNPRVFDTLKFPLRDPDGRIGAVGGISVDVTDRRRAEAALARDREFQQAILDNAPVLLGLLDRRGRFVRVNRHVERVTGYAAEELVRETVPTLLPPEELEAVGAVLEETFRTGGPTVSTNHFVTRGGERRLVEWVNTIVRDAGGEPFLLGLGHDVTDRHHAEERLRESREQLRALAARLQAAREDEKSRIARDLHDELGQLVTGLKMDLRWVEKRLADLPDGALNPVLDRVVAASELADRTVESVQRLAAELRPGALDRLGLGPALRQEARRFQERTGIACDVSIAEALPEPSGDAATALYRISQEALTNVARHAGAGRVRIALAGDAGALELRVEDDGHGLPPDAVERPSSLGLLGMTERATMLGGEVRFEPGEPRGTRVVARVPAEGTRQGGAAA